MAAKFILFLALALGLCFANQVLCRENCQSSHDYWAGIAQGIVANGGYYANANETNCLVRSGFDLQNDPCWSMDCNRECLNASEAECLSLCNLSFQQCCLETAGINAQNGLESCLGACAGVRFATDENGTCAGCEFYESNLGNCTCKMGIIDEGMGVQSFSGSVYISKFGSPDNRSISTDDVFEAGDTLYTGSDGTVTLWVGNSTQFYELKLGPDQYAKHITIISGNKVERAILMDGLPGLDTRMEVDENEPDGMRVPTYVKFANSYIEIFPETNQSGYDVRQDANQVTIIVNSGAVRVGFANQSLVASAGDSVIASPDSLVKSGIDRDNGCLGAFVLAGAALLAFARKFHA
ncbi:MAG: hypothetical protein PHS02_01550 [Candidatus ainarchaeum sp.]|nr:hypothetical protein [Candidatus ainarchaeum sp.]